MTFLFLLWRIYMAPKKSSNIIELQLNSLAYSSIEAWLVVISILKVFVKYFNHTFTFSQTFCPNKIQITAFYGLILTFIMVCLRGNDALIQTSPEYLENKKGQLE